MVSLDSKTIGNAPKVMQTRRTGSRLSTCLAQLSPETSNLRENQSLKTSSPHTVFSENFAAGYRRYRWLSGTTARYNRAPKDDTTTAGTKRLTGPV